MDNRLYKIAITFLPGIGHAASKSLVDHLGGPEPFFESSWTALQNLPISLPKDDFRKKLIQKATSELEFINRHHIGVHFFQDTQYPSLLNECPDNPLVLYSKGEFDFNQRCIGIVGTRKMTSYGKKMTEALVEGIRGQSIRIISGLAHGIDACAHRAALKNNLSTVAVLGHGLNFLYPAAHRGLAKEMITSGGGLLTEFTSEIHGDPANFPQRNRIVAGLCEALIVVESGEGGGSMITANLATDYNRDVFAFPGNADQPNSTGCNNLIKRQKAHLITCADDLMDYMHWKRSEKTTEVPKHQLVQLNIEEAGLVNLLSQHGPTHVDKLTALSKMTSSELSMHLFNLEMNGSIVTMPGKIVQLQ